MTGDHPRRWRLSAPLVVTVVAVVSVAVATDVSSDGAHLVVPPGIRVGGGVAADVLAGHAAPASVPGSPGRSAPGASTTTVPSPGPGGSVPAGAIVVQTILGPTGVDVGRVVPSVSPVAVGGQSPTSDPSSPPTATTVPTTVPSTTTTTPVPTTTAGDDDGGSGDDHGGDDHGGHSDDPTTTISTVRPDYPVVTSPGYTPPTTRDS